MAGSAAVTNPAAGRHRTFPCTCALPNRLCNRARSAMCVSMPCQIIRSAGSEYTIALRRPRSTRPSSPSRKTMASGLRFGRKPQSRHGSPAVRSAAHCVHSINREIVLTAARFVRRVLGPLSVPQASTRS